MKMWPVTKLVAKELDLSTDSMMEWMRSVGEPRITTIDGKWRCYFTYSHGHMNMKIECDWPKGDSSLRDRVEVCYVNVRRAMEALKTLKR